MGVQWGKREGLINHDAYADVSIYRLQNLSFRIVSGTAWPHRETIVSPLQIGRGLPSMEDLFQVFRPTEMG